jgi:hypothetical protein
MHWGSEVELRRSPIDSDDMSLISGKETGSGDGLGDTPASAVNCETTGASSRADSADLHPL